MLENEMKVTGEDGRNEDAEGCLDERSGGRRWENARDGKVAKWRLAGKNQCESKETTTNRAQECHVDLQ